MFAAAKPLSLEDKRLSAVYRGRLLRGETILVKWILDRMLDVEVWAEDGRKADTLLVAFVQNAYERQVPFWLAKHALLAAQTRWRHLKRNIPRAWDAIRAWQAERPWHNRIPLPVSLLRAMFSVAISWAMETPRVAHLLIPFAVLLITGFAGLLRVGEIIALRFTDVQFAEGSVVLALRSPKTKQFFGRAQFVLVSSPQVAAWLQWLSVDAPLDAKVWPSSASNFRAVFAAVLQRMDLSHTMLSPASIRPGGTTHLVILQVDLARVRFLGRWRGDVAFSCYIQEAMAQLVWLRLSEQQRSRVELLAAPAFTQLLTPPPTPWQKFFSRRRQHRSGLTFKTSKSTLR